MRMHTCWRAVGGAVLCALLTACSMVGGNGEASEQTLRAEIRRTTGGVPHIKADTIESAAFGYGYAQAEDNVCLIASAVVTARGERAKYHGPGAPGAGNVPTNIMSDFSHKALDLLGQAGREYDDLPIAARRLLDGYVAGYNRYIEATEEGAAALPAKCAGQPWVRKIQPYELYAYHQLAARSASGARFATGATFAATPPGADPAPKPAAAAAANSGQAEDLFADVDLDAIRVDLDDYPYASNGWGIGRDLSENGRGVLLANPHFPYTGTRRFYQAHITVPEVLNFNGGGLIGLPLPQIGFNRHLGWTHTVTTSQRFTLYRLVLQEGDDLAYIKDGEERPITSKNIQIEVSDNRGGTYTLEKTFYYSEYGPMLAADLISDRLPLPAWGERSAGGKRVAYSYRDANEYSAAQHSGLYLRMMQARDLEEFREAFGECGTVMWVNTIYADDQGNAYYADASGVPDVPQQALAALAKDAARARIFQSTGIAVLDGSTSRDDWAEDNCAGRVPFAQSPQLVRSDFVQNSNDSFWATNPEEFLTDYSPLFGAVERQLSDRTRMGLTMLTKPTDPGLSAVPPAGEDGKFSARDIMNMLYSNRAYLAETLLDDLLARCQAIGAEQVSGRQVQQGCAALAAWDGVYDLDSRGAHLFRLFAGQYQTRLPQDYRFQFDPADPIHTPGRPKPAPTRPADDPMLQSLAAALDILDEVAIPYDARLGDVQQVHLSTGVPPGGTPRPAGAPIPWHGLAAVPEGGFNMVRVYADEVDQGTIFPRLAPSQGTYGNNTGALSKAPVEGWWIGYGTSWHFGLQFTDDGPLAWGLMSYSQSTDHQSAHFRDQHEMYSAKRYRQLLFEEADILADPTLEIVTITSD